MTQRRDQDRAEAAVRGAWAASIGANTEEEILTRARCAPGVAFRVATLRRAGGLRTLAMWLDGVYGLMTCERIVCTHPYDERAQLEDAAHRNAEARAILARA